MKFPKGRNERTQRTIPRKLRAVLYICLTQTSPYHVPSRGNEYEASLYMTAYEQCNCDEGSHCNNITFHQGVTSIVYRENVLKTDFHFRLFQVLIPGLIASPCTRPNLNLARTGLWAHTHLGTRWSFVLRHLFPRDHLLSVVVWA